MVGIAPPPIIVTITVGGKAIFTRIKAPTAADKSNA